MPLSPEERQEWIQKWSFNWPIMDVLMSGASSIDLPSLHIKDRSEAESFAKNYGFDPNEESAKRNLDAMYVEALCFIQNILMPREWEAGNRPPPDFFTDPDPIALLLDASDREPEARTQRGKWACAILRVMHTIAHLEGFWRVVGLDEARKEMLGRFSKLLHKTEDGSLRFGSKERFIELEQLEWKHQKSRSSILLKLLHKRGNVAENVYDLLGVRIVTKRLCDVVLVVRMLEDFNVLTFPNCNPSRARNTLIDLNYFREASGLLTDMLATKKISGHEFDMLLDRVATPILEDKISNNVNPHSAQNYRSVQITSRLLVNIPNPALKWALKLADEIPKLKNQNYRDAYLNLLQSASLLQGRHEQAFIPAFVPYEFQILDSLAFYENKSGDAAHDRYKAAQIRTARRRVLSQILV